MNYHYFLNEKRTTGYILGVLIGVVILCIIEPIFYVACGYFMGWLTKVVVGDTCVNALNITFGTAIVKENLPWIGAALGWVGSFFRNTPVVKSRNS